MMKVLVVFNGVNIAFGVLFCCFNGSWWCWGTSGESQGQIC